MDEMREKKRQYLIWMFNHIEGEDIGLEEYESIRWFEQRGYTTDEAKREVLNKYRQVLLHNNDIVATIVGFDDVYGLFQVVDEATEADETIDEDEKYYKEYIDYISSRFCSYDFTVAGNKLMDDPQGIVKEIREIFVAYEIVKSLVREIEYKESQLRRYRNLIDKPETKAEKLGQFITQYGFLDLPKAKILSDESQIELIKLIANRGIPYAVAMFDHLGFIKHLSDNYFQVKGKMYKEMAKWFGVDEREIKGNIAVLNEKSKEDRTRYTTCEQRDKVKGDFEKLK